MSNQKEVDELWEKVKDNPNLERNLGILERAGMLRPIVVCPPPSESKEPDWPSALLDPGLRKTR
jgi:hypothetical protein